MNDILSVAIGVVIGVLASVPVSVVIAISTRPRTRYLRDTCQTDVMVEPPSSAIVIFDPEILEML